jgi:hypothetical protein
MHATTTAQTATPGQSTTIIWLAPAEVHNLDLLRHNLHAVLAPSPSDGIVQVTARKLVLVFENLYHHVLTITGTNNRGCVAPAALNLEQIPKGAKIGQADLDFVFAGSPVSRSAQIHPGYLKVEQPADAPRIAAFLAKRRFIAPRKLVTLAAIFIALALALTPDFYTNIAENDDDDDHHHHTHALRC